MKKTNHSYGRWCLSILRTKAYMSIYLDDDGNKMLNEYIREYKIGDHPEPKEKKHVFKLEILAGNARKVSAGRFERLYNGDKMLEAKEVTLIFPKIVKRKWNSGMMKGTSDTY